jgi:hypothetical protein
MQFTMSLHLAAKKEIILKYKLHHITSLSKPSEAFLPHSE